MSIPKKGGYSGGRPASQMGPPANIASRILDPQDDLRDLIRGTTDESSVTIIGADGPRKGWPVEKLQERVEHHQSLHAAGDRRLTRDGEVIVTLSRQLQLAIAREALAKAQLDEAVNGDEARAHRATVVDLAALALFHAQHEGVSEGDRKKVLDLVVRISDHIGQNRSAGVPHG